MMSIVNADGIKQLKSKIIITAKQSAFLWVLGLTLIPTALPLTLKVLSIRGITPSIVLESTTKVIKVVIIIIITCTVTVRILSLKIGIVRIITLEITSSTTIVRIIPKWLETGTATRAFGTFSNLLSCDLCSFVLYLLSFFVKQ